MSALPRNHQSSPCSQISPQITSYMPDLWRFMCGEKLHLNEAHFSERWTLLVCPEPGGHELSRVPIGPDTTLDTGPLMRKTTVERLRTFQRTGMHSDFLQRSLEFTKSLRIKLHFGPTSATKDMQTRRLRKVHYVLR